MDNKVEMWMACFPRLVATMDECFGDKYDGYFCDWAKVSYEEMIGICPEGEKEYLLGPYNSEGDQLLVNLANVETAYDFRQEWQELAE